MKQCDILGVKTYSDPSYIFSGYQDPLNPQDTRPWSRYPVKQTYTKGLDLITL